MNPFTILVLAIQGTARNEHPAEHASNLLECRAHHNRQRRPCVRFVVTLASRPSFAVLDGVGTGERHFAGVCGFTLMFWRYRDPIPRPSDKARWRSRRAQRVAAERDETPN